MDPATPFNFLGLPEEFSSYKNSHVVVLPVPFDLTSTWGKGADKGPRALIDASRTVEFYDIELECEPFRCGIHTAKEICSDSPEKMVTDVYTQVKKYLKDGKFVALLGGEHSVAVGSIKAHAEEFGPITVLQLDAHTDMRSEYEGSPLNHACAMARAKEFKGVDRVVGMGIRAIDQSEFSNIDFDNVFFAERLIGSGEWKEEILNRLGERVYITLDLDVFDPSIMSSTGTPEPGGLGWYEVLDFLRLVFERRQVVGVDVVELCPNSSNRAPDFLAAKLLYKMIGYSDLDNGSSLTV